MPERTFVMIKPEHVNLADYILEELRQCGTLVQQTMIERVPREIIERHYAIHRERPFYLYLVESFVDKPVVLAIYEGEGIVQKVMKQCGPTDPAKAPQDTIRGKYSTDSLEKAIAEQRPCQNVIHRSDSPSEAEREMAVWESYFR